MTNAPTNRSNSDVAKCRLLNSNFTTCATFRNTAHSSECLWGRMRITRRVGSPKPHTVDAIDCLYRTAGCGKKHACGSNRARTQDSGVFERLVGGEPATMWTASRERNYESWLCRI